jgi:BASS family bile acid:Na+ symporter
MRPDGDRIQAAFVATTIVLTMVSMGLQLSGGRIVASLRRPRLLTVALVLNLAVVPALAWLIARTLSLSTGAEIGFLVIAAAAGAPIGAKLAELARGDLAFAVGLMFILAAVAPLTTAPIARLILPADASARIDLPRALAQQIAVQLLPLLVGLAVHRLWPHLAERLRRPSILASTGLLGITLVVVVLNSADDVRSVGWEALGAMLVLSGVSLLLGWMLGGPGVATRRSLALTSGERASGLALLVATTSFAGTGADVAVVAYGLCLLVLNVAVALVLRGRAAREQVTALAT